MDECSGQSSHHLSVLREVLERRDWAVERSGSLAKALKTPLTALCARSAKTIIISIIMHVPPPSPHTQIKFIYI